MKIAQFEDILAWQKAFDLTTQIYTDMRGCRDAGFCDQIQRAAVSIMNNIAEGYERQSNRDFAHFLFIAKGSCGETRSMVLLGQKLGYLSSQKSEMYYNITIEISKMLSGLIKSLKPTF